MKYFDTSKSDGTLIGLTVTWVGNVVGPTTTINLGAPAVANPQCLFAPTVGSALNQRIGRAVKMHKIKIKGAVIMASQAFATNQPFLCRVFVALDKQTNGTQADANDILNSGSDGISTCNSYQTPNNFGRFQILYDKIYQIDNFSMVRNAAGDPQISGKMIPWKLTHKFKPPLEVRFNGVNGGTIADLVDNSINVYAGVTDQSTNPTLSFYSRVSYKE